MKNFSIRSFCINSAVILLSIVISLVLAEYVVRIAAPQKMYRFPQHLFLNHDTANYAMVENFQGTANTHEYKTEINTNEVGIRDDREPSEISPDDFQILSVGDSFTMGVGVNVQNTYLRRLEEKLNTRNTAKSTRVINLGVPGYETSDSFFLLEDKGSHYAPSAILLTFFVGNDIAQNKDDTTKEVVNGYLKNKGTKSGLLPTSIRDFLQVSSHLYHVIWPLQRKLLDANYAEDMKASQIRHFSIYDSRIGLDDELWSRTDEEIGRLVATWKSRGIPVYMVVVPEQMQVIPGRWDDTVQLLDIDGAIYQRNNASRRLLEICEGQGIQCVDLLPPFTTAAQDQAMYFPDDGHWNVVGNDLAAEVVADQLAPVWQVAE